MAKHFSHTGTDDILLGDFIELSLDPAVMNGFSNEQALSSYLSSHSEEFQALRLELLKEVIFIIDTHCTEKQREIVRMIFLEEKTQTKVALDTNRAQSTISKSLIGNAVFGGEKKYGGIMRKVRKLCGQNKKIQEILKNMRELCKK